MREGLRRMSATDGIASFEHRDPLGCRRLKECAHGANTRISEGGIAMKGMGNMMKQAQKLQSKMAKMQEELAERTVEGTAGGGMVKVVANGRQQVLDITIEKEVVDPDDLEMLQDLILAAVNDALGKAQEMVANEMGKLTGGMSIPGLF